MKKIKKVLSALGVFGAIFGVCCTIQSAGAMQRETPRDKVVFVGDSDFDRTQVFRRLANNYSDANSVGSDGNIVISDKKIVINDYGYEISLDLHNVSGKEMYKKIGIDITRDANTVVLVYDVNKQAQSQGELQYWIDQIKDHNPEASFILLASKCDELNHNDSEDRLKAMANNLGIEVKDSLPVCSKTNYNIEELGQMLAQKALDRANKVQENSEVKNLTDSQNKKSGCLLL